MGFWDARDFEQRLRERSEGPGMDQDLGWHDIERTVIASRQARNSGISCWRDSTETAGPFSVTDLVQAL